MSDHRDASKKTSSTLRPYQRGLAAAVVLGLVLAPLIFGAVIFELNREFSRSSELRQVVDSSFEERSQLQTVFSLLQDAETSQRGYIITGQKTYLQPLEDAERQIGPAFARLRTLQASGAIAYPHKAELTASLLDLAGKRLRGARHAASLRDAQGVIAAEAFVSSGRGKAIMDQIRVVVAQMGVAEQRALNERIAMSDAASTQAEAVTIGMFAALAVLLVAAYALVLRQAHGRQRLLLQAQTSATRQSAIFENAQDAMVIFNPSGTLKSVNRAAEVMFGRERDSLSRRDIGLLLDMPDDKRLFLERISEGQDLNAGVMREFTAKRRGGDSFPVEVTLGQITLPEGDRVVAAIRDISERRRVETMKSEFISTVSHELRTPLTSIAGSLGLLLGGAVGQMPDKATRLLGIAHSNCQRLVRLINDILDIEKIESGKMNFNLAAHDLGDLARRGVEAIAGMALDTKIRLKLDVASNLPPVLGDSDRLAQVIANLLSNAVKFSPPEGLVEVAVDSSPAGRVRLSVRDHGPGVPDAFRERIFTKFAQADSSDTRQKGGTGLGLVISKEIMERHGGTLTFESNPGEGAVFVIDLPALSRGAGVLRPLPGPTRASRVLLVEDDPDVAEVLSQTLASEDLEVEVAGTLAEAEARLREDGNYAALLLDVRLPDGSGLDLLERLRANPRTQRLPVMIISAEAGVGHALDVVDWIQKPVDAGRLRRSVAAAIADDPRQNTRVLHVEDDADVRQIVADALSPRCSVIGVEGLTAARKALQLTTPDLVILDLGLADGSGVDLLPELKYPDGSRIPVVIFSAQSLSDHALAESVDAVLTKSKMSLDQLSNTVRGLARVMEADMATGVD